MYLLDSSASSIDQTDVENPSNPGLSALAAAELDKNSIGYQLLVKNRKDSKHNSPEYEKR